MDVSCVCEMFQPKHTHLCIRPPITSGVTHILWKSSTQSNFHMFFFQTGRKCFILLSRVYNTHDGNSLTLLSTCHLSYSYATTYFNHFTRFVYIGDAALISSMCNHIFQSFYKVCVHWRSRSHLIHVQPHISIILPGFCTLEIPLSSHPCATTYFNHFTRFLYIGDAARISSMCNHIFQSFYQVFVHWRFRSHLIHVQPHISIILPGFCTLEMPLSSHPCATTYFNHFTRFEYIGDTALISSMCNHIFQSFYQVFVHWRSRSHLIHVQPHISIILPGFCTLEIPLSSHPCSKSMHLQSTIFKNLFIPTLQRSVELDHFNSIESNCIRQMSDGWNMYDQVRMSIEESF